MNNYVYKTDTDFRSGYYILRKIRLSTDPWISIARIDDEGGISFSKSTSHDEQEEIKNVARLAGIL